MNRLYELLEITRRNTAAAKKIDKKLDAMNKELKEDNKKYLEGN